MKPVWLGLLAGLFSLARSDGLLWLALTFLLIFWQGRPDPYGLMSSYYIDAANGILLPFFAEREILLVDFKLEFGRHDGRLMVGDELTPDGCRFWDRSTRERLGKDRTRRSPAREAAAYQEVFQRICS